jgi:hypothetical protein
VELTSQLEALPSSTWHVGDLLGRGWSRYYRFLHPAYDVAGARPVPIGWREVARRRGIDVDLASAAWHDVSGSRLHHPRPDAAFAAEPVAGPVSAVLLPILRSLPTTPDDEAVFVAEWIGYDQVASTRELAGSRRLGVRSLGSLDYSVWQSDLDTVGDLVGADAIVGPSASESVQANYVWPVSGSWLVVASPDLASTYCATRSIIDRWSPALEWVEVSAETPLG